jgi:hypothetical protein
MKLIEIGLLTIIAAPAFAQAPAESGSSAAPAAANLKQLMLDLIYPASNDILLVVSRGGPSGESEWAAVRRGAVTLAESGNLLLMRGPKGDANWIKDARMLMDAGSAAYQAARAKDGKALAALPDAIDASCTACHRQFRPNVFPLEGSARESASTQAGEPAPRRAATQNGPSKGGSK